MTIKTGVLLNAEYEHGQLIALAQLAETLGYHCLWYADERFYRETYTGLAACALSTSRIYFGTAVTDPYTRHPALTAAAIASLDELSGGRAILGYAAGASGFRNLGLHPYRSSVALREGIYIIRRLLAGEEVTYQGEVISIWHARMKFATRAEIPIYLAADGPHNMRLAGEIADGVIIPHCASLRILTPKLEQVHHGQELSFRSEPPKVVARLDVSVSHNRAAALFQAKVRLVRILWSQYPNIKYLGSHGLKLPSNLDRRLHEAGPFPGGHDLAVFRPFADAIPDEFVFPVALAGTPAEVAQQAQPIIGMGADQIMAYLLVPHGETIESVIKLYAEEVMPRLG
jgi:5,10-methylenetetrahydromethanopterin reductase